MTLDIRTTPLSVEEQAWLRQIDIACARLDGWTVTPEPGSAEAQAAGEYRVLDPSGRSQGFWRWGVDPWPHLAPAYTHSLRLALHLAERFGIVLVPHTALGTEALAVWYAFSPDALSTYRGRHLGTVGVYEERWPQDTDPAIAICLAVLKVRGIPVPPRPVHDPATPLPPPAGNPPMASVRLRVFSLHAERGEIAYQLDERGGFEPGGRGVWRTAHEVLVYRYRLDATDADRLERVLSGVADGSLPSPSNLTVERHR